eukprot:3618629-Amphidinium_carterae.1
MIEAECAIHHGNKILMVRQLPWKAPATKPSFAPRGLLMVPGAVTWPKIAVVVRDSLRFFFALVQLWPTSVADTNYSVDVMRAKVERTFAHSVVKNGDPCVCIAGSKPWEAGMGERPCIPILASDLSRSPQELPQPSSSRSLKSIADVLRPGWGATVAATPKRTCGSRIVARCVVGAEMPNWHLHPNIASEENLAKAGATGRARFHLATTTP